MIQLVAGSAHAVAAALPAFAPAVRAAAKDDAQICVEIAGERLTSLRLVASIAEVYRLRTLRRAETGDDVSVRVV